MYVYVGDSQTPNSGLRHTSFNRRQVPESGVRSVGDSTCV